MSFRDYLHEKAEESRHNETLAYMMFLAGAVFLVGGIMETISLAGTPNWFLLLPYSTESTMGAVLGLTMMIGGISLIVFGVAAGMTYSRDRGWYMQELRKASSMEESMLQDKSKKNSNNRKKRQKLTEPVSAKL